MENIETRQEDSNGSNDAHLNESSGTGVLGSLVFMGLALLIMIVISNFLH